MNIFSNIGITELIVILLLALLVVGPERLPEMGRKLAETLRNLRKAYENLTKDLGPELMSIQQTTRELRESVDSVRSIPQDVVQSVVRAADLEDTIEELKGAKGSLQEVGQTLSSAGKMVKDPVGAAVGTARNALLPKGSGEAPEAEDKVHTEVTSEERMITAVPEVATIGTSEKAATDAPEETAADASEDAVTDAIEVPAAGAPEDAVTDAIEVPAAGAPEDTTTGAAEDIATGASEVTSTDTPEEQVDD